MSTKDIILPVFHFKDYISLCFLLIISILIGLYFSIFKKDNTTEGYLFGNRKFGALPVSISLIASAMSCLGAFGWSSEVYYFGSDFYYIILGFEINYAVLYIFYLPVFYNLRITTLYEYLEKRFSKKVRVLCSVLYTLNLIFSMVVAMYMSSLMLNQVSGISFVIITIVSGAITTLYTAIGGIRAVIWTDVVQAFFMYIGLILLSVKGTIDLGGFREIWKINYDGDRLTVPKCIIFYAVGHTIINCFPIYIGLLVFATFRDCDPFTGGKISAKDQVVPLFIMKTLKNSSGLPGMIVASLLSATLSTVSTQLNSAAAIILHDYYKPFTKGNLSEAKSMLLLKVIIVIMGVFATLGVFLLRKTQSVIQMYIVLSGVINGPVLGIFTIGILLPRIKSKATFLGSVAGCVVICWIYIGAELTKVPGYSNPMKPLSVQGCEQNITFVNVTMKRTTDVFILYRISNLWYPTISFLITIIVACLLNLFLENNDIRTMDSKLFSPIIHRFYNMKNTEPSGVEMELLRPR